MNEVEVVNFEHPDSLHFDMILNCFEREDIKLVKPAPVIWVYMTGWASADGVVHFRDDVYNVDTVGG